MKIEEYAPADLLKPYIRAYRIVESQDWSTGSFLTIHLLWHSVLTDKFLISTVPKKIRCQAQHCQVCENQSG